MFGKLQTSCHIQTQPEKMWVNGKCHICWPHINLLLHVQTLVAFFIVDTGAQVSVIPATWMNKRAGSTCQPLQAANGIPILTFGALSVLEHGHAEIVGKPLNTHILLDLVNGLCEKIAI